MRRKGWDDGMEGMEGTRRWRCDGGNEEDGMEGGGRTAEIGKKRWQGRTKMDKMGCDQELI